MPKRQDIHKILIIGSGPIIIGQACEFDYSGTQACKALRSLGYRIVLVNSNPATIMTDPGMADATYIEPLNVESLREIIKKERPDALLPNLGGQTALNLSSDLAEAGILEQYGVQVIGVNLDAIKRGEDRDTFKKTMAEIGIETALSEIVTTMEEAMSAVERMGLPVVVRPAYTMGGTGGGFAYNMEEFEDTVARGLAASPVRQVLIEESVRGWEELELEVVRDATGHKITICFIENVDPMGVHTGDSFCTAPMLTISGELQARLQDYAYRIVDAIEVIGGTNVQFAHDPVTDRVVVIEINPRTSRSSALASKATGFPIALISAMLAAGLTLKEIPYWRDGTLDRYTPSGDYVVVKFARWAFEKFQGVHDRLGTQMRAVGEVMSIGKHYKEALQKAIRSLEIGRYGLGFAKDFHEKSLDALLAMLVEPCSERHFILYEALRKGADVDTLYEITRVKPWFLGQMKELVALEEEILTHKGTLPPEELLVRAKKDGFADRYLAQLLALPEEAIREKRKALNLKSGWEAVPVSGVDNAAYYYSTWHAEDRVAVSDGKKVMVLGGGPNRIGQGIEFDYCCVHTAFALKDAGYETIMVNCNPETVSTDYDTSDKLYFEPLTVEDVLAIYEKEHCEGVVVQFGGQTPLNIAKELEAAGVPILGTSPATIDMAEDRAQFNAMMERLGIPQPDSGMAATEEEAIAIAARIAYPLMVRPSYVLGGRAMEVVHDEASLRDYLSRAVIVTPDRPVLIDRFLQNATEAEADAICDGITAFVPAVMEHIEMAGVHSGDSACVIPPVTIPLRHIETIEDYTRKIAVEMGVKGLMNIQYAISDDKVYILEANPRASRTVPLVSKVCAIPMARIAVRIMLGEKLADLGLRRPVFSHFGVKEAVFPFPMFPEVDPVLGPEMRSTGEVLGMAHSPGLAFFKAEEATGASLPLEGSVLITVADPDKKDALVAAKLFHELGFRVLATGGTHAFLEENGVPAERVKKMLEGRPNIADAVKNNEVQLLLNTPSGKRSITDDSYIRKAAIRFGVPYITTPAAAIAAAKGIAARRQGKEAVQSLQEFHADMC
ncbi:carbamoyl-phosphate synthase large subunit [Desulfobotulus sp. H1]|uniref:Carbamoyl phosphate synthase large chain n=1 Tax=Desulfobotulus pelophilus TaxID=2823377 RepID=A0ABT3N8Z2_9BACT|nr:carbamoyl-phosphate synthase large subunit [Desulfobotulus pelophilus]MCW7753914.1 carbamoyl-phosphate synthase large subunit [Desulfobotulus pelophilus]